MSIWAEHLQEARVFIVIALGLVGLADGCGRTGGGGDSSEPELPPQQAGAAGSATTAAGAGADGAAGGVSMTTGGSGGASSAGRVGTPLSSNFQRHRCWRPSQSAGQESYVVEPNVERRVDSVDHELH